MRSETDITALLEQCQRTRQQVRQALDDLPTTAASREELAAEYDSWVVITNVLRWVLGADTLYPYGQSENSE